MMDAVVSSLVTRLIIHGRVQGVGFRNWTQHTARRHALEGWVRNRSNGTVEALLYGPDAAVTAMVAECRRGPAGARVDRIDQSAGSESELGLRSAGVGQHQAYQRYSCHLKRHDQGGADLFLASK